MVIAINTKNSTDSHKFTSSAFGKIVAPKLRSAEIAGKTDWYVAP